MPGKIFVNYRRDDVPGDARGVRDGLAAKFGKSAIFMDVDNLLVGQRFDIELARALDDCDMLLAVIGPRWTELMKARTESGERDYVREEIAEALKRRIAVVPVRVGREGSMPALPRPEDLPEDIRELVLYQKHDVAHERFGRDMAELIAAIVALRKATAGGQQGPARPMGKIALAVLGLAMLAGAVSYAGGLWGNGVGRVETARPDVPAASSRDVGSPPSTRPTAAGEAERKRVADLQAEIARRDAALARAEEDRKHSEAEAAKLRAEAEARQKADVEAKRKADEAERQRVAAAEQRQKELDEQRRRDAAAVEAKRKAEEEAARRAPQAGQAFRDCNDGCPEMVVVPAGSFMMGAPAGLEKTQSVAGSRPQRRVTIRQPFAVGKFEVTFAEWEACVAGGGCAGNPQPFDRGWGKERRPVINVSWHDAKQYIDWLSKKTSGKYRLLTQAEWEYAAGAGAASIWPFGNDGRQIDEYAWYMGNSSDSTHPVGLKLPNAFGLHDIIGNVEEWLEDCHYENLSNMPIDGSAAPETTNCTRSQRGGSLWQGPLPMQTSFRHSSGTRPTVRYISLGFRVAKSLDR